MMSDYTTTQYERNALETARKIHDNGAILLDFSRSIFNLRELLTSFEMPMGFGVTVDEYVQDLFTTHDNRALAGYMALIASAITEMPNSRDPELLVLSALTNIKALCNELGLDFNKLTNGAKVICDLETGALIGDPEYDFREARIKTLENYNSEEETVKALISFLEEALNEPAGVSIY
jgi:hypothetical protein